MFAGRAPDPATGGALLDEIAERLRLQVRRAEKQGLDEPAVVLGEADPEVNLALVDGEDALGMGEARRGD